MDLTLSLSQYLSLGCEWWTRSWLTLSQLRCDMEEMVEWTLNKASHTLRENVVQIDPFVCEWDGICRLKAKTLCHQNNKNRFSNVLSFDDGKCIAFVGSSATHTHTMQCSGSNNLKLVFFLVRLVGCDGGMALNIYATHNDKPMADTLTSNGMEKVFRQASIVPTVSLCGSECTRKKHEHTFRSY